MNERHPPFLLFYQQFGGRQPLLSGELQSPGWTIIVGWARERRPTLHFAILLPLLSTEWQIPLRRTEFIPLNVFSGKEWIPFYTASG